KLSDIGELAGFFFSLPEYPPDLLVWSKSTKEKMKESLPAVSEALKSVSESEFTAVAVKNALVTLASRFTNGEMYWPLRVALSGKEFSPGPTEIAEVLGKDEMLLRVQRAIAKLEA
ncbi:glutamate--tRNA ligase, partial [Candidatus Azambacteria bacterium]|nr:glutamate--tRNA ligase [Candidatus Azambacteria bacterium]